MEKCQGFPTCKIIFLIFYKNRKRKLDKYQGVPTCKIIFLIFYLIAPKMIDTVFKYFLWSNSCVAKYAVLKVSLQKNLVWKVQNQSFSVRRKLTKILCGLCELIDKILSCVKHHKICILDDILYTDLPALP